MLVQRVAALELHLADDDSVGEDFRILVKMAVLVDKGGDTAVRESCGGHAVLDGAVAHEVQVLVGCGTAAEPSVVRDVHHQARTFVDGLAHEVAKDGVVADERRPLELAVHGSFLARHKVAFAQIHVVQDGEDVVERDALAEGDEVLFDIALVMVLVVGRKQERGIVDVELARAARLVPLVVEGSREDARVMAVGELVQVVDGLALATDVVGDGRFGEDDDVRAFGDAVVHHAERFRDNAAG